VDVDARRIAYVAGFHDGYLRAVEEVNQLLGILPVDVPGDRVERRVSRLQALLKVFGLALR
jgi:hypothetical protein